MNTGLPFLPDTYHSEAFSLREQWKGVTSFPKLNRACKQPMVLHETTVEQERPLYSEYSTQALSCSKCSIKAFSVNWDGF